MSKLVSSRVGPSAGEAGRLLEVARMLSDFPELDKRKKQIYTLWIMGYLRYAEANDLGDPEPSHINRFLDRLSEKKGIDDSMRQQAAEALVFFHECVLDQNVSEVHGRLSMLSRDERQRILSQLSGPEKLLARIVFHTELDLTEALRLRVGDVDLNRGQITVSNAQGVSNRFVDLSSELTVAMERHMKRVHDTHQRDLEEGHGTVDLPPSIRDQFPGAGSAWVWQYIFPSPRRTVDLHSGRERRYPMQPTNLLDAIEMLTEPRTRHFISSMSRGMPDVSDTTIKDTGAVAKNTEPKATETESPQTESPQTESPETSKPQATDAAAAPPGARSEATAPGTAPSDAPATAAPVTDVPTPESPPSGQASKPAQPDASAIDALPDEGEDEEASEESHSQWQSVFAS